ncbi:hypothetical protein IGV50_004413 [Salmonella enterica subsp. enterica serovar Newport]|nr:hypothetical protein [Salmonella enterica subsp. enterica serovar Newport]
MIFPSEEIKSSADFKAACTQDGKAAIKILMWLQHECKENAFLEGATAEKRNEMFHKHKHLESAIQDINNQIASFAPDFNTK